MRYGIYKAVETNCTTFWFFPLTDNEEAESRGFKLIDKVRTKKEASKMVDRYYESYLTEREA